MIAGLTPTKGATLGIAKAIPIFFEKVYEENFISSIEKETSNTTKVNYRFKTWSNVLADIMKQEIDNPNPRCFPDSLKTKLFNRKNIKSRFKFLALFYESSAKKYRI